MIKNSKLFQFLYAIPFMLFSAMSFANSNEDTLDLSELSNNAGSLMIDILVLIEKGLYFAGIIFVILAVVEIIKMFGERKQGKGTLALVYVLGAAFFLGFPTLVKYIANTFGGKNTSSRVSINATKSDSSLTDIFGKGKKGTGTGN